MKSELMMKLSRTCHKIGYSMKKNSPEILVVAGVVGVVTSAVIACLETRKLDDILDESKNNIEEIKKQESENEKKELTKAYASTGMKVAKLYAPSVILGTCSITSILVGHDILKKRSLALAAAYATVDKGFKEYRKNVVARFGEEVDKELKYGLKKGKIEEVEVDENGKTKTVKTNCMVSNLSEYSDWAVYFDETCREFQNVRDYDLMILRALESYCNDLLRLRGYLTLNEVLDKLGIKPTEKMKKAGMVVGWIYDENNPDYDNYVSFNIQETYREREDNGLIESVILLDFNVDGNIYDRM